MFSDLSIEATLIPGYDAVSLATSLALGWMPTAVVLCLKLSRES